MIDAASLIGGNLTESFPASGARHDLTNRKFCREACHTKMGDRAKYPEKGYLKTGKTGWVPADNRLATHQ